MTYLTLRPRRTPWSGDMEDWFEDFFRWPARTGQNEGFAPRANIDETKDAIKVTFELPGMDKKDIKVTVHEGVLTVSGKREFKTEGTTKDGYMRREISTGEFTRSFTLPDTVNPDSITADYKNGLLEVKLAKLEEVKPKEIDIKVS